MSDDHSHTGSERPHLIVLRGNSSAGKSTLAHRLQHDLGRGTANIGQDHVRRIMLREHDVEGGDNIALLRTITEFCLGIDYHVIIEGILAEDHYGDMLRHLVRHHEGPTHVFYLDVELDESLDRHESRPLRAEVLPEAVRSWYTPQDLLGLPDEIVLDTSTGPDSVHDAARQHIGPVRRLNCQHEDAHVHRWLGTVG
jgi:predicted kinase